MIFCHCLPAFCHGRKKGRTGFLCPLASGGQAVSHSGCRKDSGKKGAYIDRQQHFDVGDSQQGASQNRRNQKPGTLCQGKQAGGFGVFIRCQKVGDGCTEGGFQQGGEKGAGKDTQADLP